MRYISYPRWYDRNRHCIRHRCLGVDGHLDHNLRALSCVDLRGLSVGNGNVDDLNKAAMHARSVHVLLASRKFSTHTCSVAGILLEACP